MNTRDLHRYLFTAFCIMFPVLLFSQMYTKQRDVSRSFRVQSQTMVQLTNKYGNISVIPWETDSVRIEVHMVVQGKQMSKVDKIMSSIDFEIMAFGNYINARTYFLDNQATFWKDVVSYAGQVINTSNNLQIDYTVYLPPSVDLRIDNKFGNVFTDSHEGNVEIKLANGDLQARDFKGNLKLNIEFGTVTIQDANAADLVVNYSDLSLNSARSLIVNSRSSTISIEQAGSLEINSQRDKVNIKQLKQLGGDTYFSKVKIIDLESIVTLNTRYGELKLNSVGKGFRNIRLNAEYTDVFLNFDQGASYAMDLTYDSKTRLSLAPALSAQLRKEIKNPQTGKVNATGSHGKSGSALVFVTMKAGALAIFNK